jgi:hypothetical protein
MPRVLSPAARRSSGGPDKREQKEALMAALMVASPPNAHAGWDVAAGLPGTWQVKRGGRGGGASSLLSRLRCFPNFFFVEARFHFFSSVELARRDWPGATQIGRGSKPKQGLEMMMSAVSKSSPPSGGKRRQQEEGLWVMPRNLSSSSRSPRTNETKRSNLPSPATARRLLLGSPSVLRPGCCRQG